MKIALYISSQSEKIKGVIFIIHKPILPLHFCTPEIFFNKVNEEFLLIAVSDGKMPTGLLRVKIEEAVGKMKAVLESLKDAFLRLSFPVNFAGEAGR